VCQAGNHFLHELDKWLCSRTGQPADSRRPEWKELKRFERAMRQARAAFLSLRHNLDLRAEISSRRYEAMLQRLSKQGPAGETDFRERYAGYCGLVHTRLREARQRGDAKAAAEWELKLDALALARALREGREFVQGSTHNAINRRMLDGPCNYMNRRRPYREVPPCGFRKDIDGVLATMRGCFSYRIRMQVQGWLDTLPCYEGRQQRPASPRPRRSATHKSGGKAGKGGSA
jgi:hypothetical protein